MSGEPAFAARKHRFIRGPWPAAEVGTLVIAKGLLNLVSRIHDEGPVLSNRFGDGTSLQQKELTFGRSVLKLDFAIRIEFSGGKSVQRSICNTDAAAAEEIQ